MITNFKHLLMYAEDVFDKKKCDKVLRKYWGRTWKDATVKESGNKEQVQIDETLRISEVLWLKEQWIFDYIWPWMQEANDQTGWCYDIRGCEDIQLTRYKVGSFYDFHTDGLGDHVSKDHGGMVRKLSMTIFLNDDYEGGEFQFAKYHKGEVEILTQEHKAGGAVIFPSSLDHRVKPVTKGVRYSLVIWFIGPPFA